MFCSPCCFPSSEVDDPSSEQYFASSYTQESSSVEISLKKSTGSRANSVSFNAPKTSILLRNIKNTPVYTAFIGSAVLGVLYAQNLISMFPYLHLDQASLNTDITVLTYAVCFTVFGFPLMMIGLALRHMIRLLEECLQTKKIDSYEY